MEWPEIEGSHECKKHNIVNIAPGYGCPECTKEKTANVKINSDMTREEQVQKMTSFLKELMEGEG